MKGKPSNFIAFDIGSSKIAAIAAYVGKQGDAKINSQILQYSEGFKSGNITNMERAENSIIGAVYALEQDLDKSIKEITLSLSGAGVKSFYINHKMKLGGNVVSKQDVKKLVSKALAEFSVQGREIVHYFPLEFTIDHNQTVENPVGMHASEIGCQIHVIAADSLMLMNLTKALSKCHIDASQIVVSIYASGIACLSDDEKDLGSIIVDVGNNTTSFGIFLDGKIVYVGHVPMGSFDITRDIAKFFSISLQAAEKLKILYGNANPGLLVNNNAIRLDEIEPQNDYGGDLSISSEKLAQIINKRVRETFLKIKKQCDQISMDHILARRLILTGGGAALSGIKSVAAEIFQKQVRIAKPELLPGGSEEVNPYMYSVVVGMVKSEIIKHQKKSLGPEFDDNAGWLKKTISWLKENI